jgi:integrase
MNDLFDAYLADRKKVVRSYQSLFYALKPIREQFGNYAAADITPQAIATYTDMRRFTVKKATITKELVVTRSALSFGKKNGWLEVVPHIENPGQDTPKDRWISRDEADSLVAGAVEPHIKLFILMGIFTGARTSAILNLAWDRVDFDRNLVIYPPADPRSNKRTAIVPFNESLREQLLSFKSAALTDNVIEFRGNTVASIKKGFERARQRSGIDHCTPHDLRRTCATWLVMAGIKTAQVARYLGDTEEMIEKVYGHHSPDYLREAADVFGTIGTD